MTTRARPTTNDAVTAYIDAAEEPGRSRLRKLRAVIRREAPDAVERIAYGLATWHQSENLIHLGAFRQHVGIYPGPAAIEAFADDLTSFKSSKGAIQLPHDKPLPIELVRRITRWRVEQVAQKPATKATRRPAAKAKGGARTPTSPRVSADVAAYNAARSDADRATCEALVEHISRSLPLAEGKLWHGHPVWFLEGNPIVGYSTHKDGTRLLFWSGQSFDDPKLAATGKFKAAEARYAGVGDIDAKPLRRWLQKAKTVQWDYKNVVKNRGVLVRLV